MRVRDLLDVPGLGLRLLTDVTGLDRAITHVYTTDLPDPGRYLTAGDLVLTGMMWCREPGDAERFVTVLARAGTAVSRGRRGPGPGAARGHPGVRTARRHPARGAARDLVRRGHRGGWAAAERRLGDRHDPGARAAQAAAVRGGAGGGRTGDRKLAEAIITMLASGGAEGAAPVEIASLMRAVGLPPDGLSRRRAALGPLVAYDQRHRAELLPTLR